eukprot:GGOE01011690.1.p1 GENE.GGOE01011690.1~~GGOE01011690.1.p1  ORF type:complete len:358 (-),score=52.98 GGOE01011690.1:1933-3006(-)
MERACRGCGLRGGAGEGEGDCDAQKERVPSDTRRVETEACRDEAVGFGAAVRKGDHCLDTVPSRSTKSERNGGDRTPRPGDGQMLGSGGGGLANSARPTLSLGLPGRCRFGERSSSASSASSFRLPRQMHLGLGPLAVISKLSASTQAVENHSPLTHTPMTTGCSLVASRSPRRPSLPAIRVQAESEEERDPDDVSSASSVDGSHAGDATPKQHGAPNLLWSPTAAGITREVSLGSSSASPTPSPSVGPRSSLVSLPSIAGWEEHLRRIATGDTFSRTATNINFGDDDLEQRPDSPPPHRRFCGTAINLRKVRHRHVPLPPTNPNEREAAEDDPFPFQSSFQLSPHGPLVAWTSCQV